MTYEETEARRQRVCTDIAARPLTLAAVRAFRDFIKERAGDDEDAHALEDLLRDAVLEAIAKDECELVQSVAALAFSTNEIDFTRWYA